MKMNKLTKFGISLISVVALGAVAPALTNNPIFGITVVKADERQGQIEIRIRYLDEHSREIAPMYTGVLNPGESVNIYKDIEGHQVVSNFSWMPGYNLTYNIASTYFYGAKDGYLEGYLRYKKLDPVPTPDPAPTPDPVPTPDKPVVPTPTPDPVPTPDPAKPAQDQKDPGKPDKAQLPETGEESSTFATLLGLLTASLALLSLRKKKY